MDKFFLLLIYLLLARDFIYTEALEKTRFCVLIPSYNNEKWYEKNLTALAQQNYSNWYALYLNDCSLDRTGELVEKWLTEHPMQDKIQVIHNKERLGPLANTYYAALMAQPEDVIVIYDGDDWFNGSEVFNKLAAVYANPQIWITYGSCISYPASFPNELCLPYADKIQKKNAFRNVPWVVSHLRTFYARLFQAIDEQDLKNNGNFFFAAGDVAYMFPMLEMASLGHIQFVPDFLYVYNQTNPISENKINLKLQKDSYLEIKKRHRYDPLESLIPFKVANSKKR